MISHEILDTEKKLSNLKTFFKPAIIYDSKNIFFSTFAI